MTGSRASYRQLDVVYRADPQLLARFYLPQTSEPAPLVVDVHGGAWCMGDRLTNAVFHHALAGAGLAVMAIDFRSPPQHRYPASVADVQNAIRWARRNAGALGCAPDRIAALGTSSGGHQLLLALLRPDDPRLLDDPSLGAQAGDLDLSALVLCWPVADPLERYRMVQARQLAPLLAAHHAYWPDEAAMGEGNPQQILAAGGDLPALPPALVLQGTRDANLPEGSAERLAEAYRSAGGDVRLEIFPGQIHGFISQEPEAAESLSALAMIADFLCAGLRQAPPPKRVRDKD